MSRIGRKPIVIPEGVNINIDENKVVVRGPKGELSLEVNASIKLNLEDSRLTLSPTSDDRDTKAKFGLYRSLINNMVIGVSEGFSKTLKIVGVGYRVTKKDKAIELLVGYSHPVVVEEIPGITFEVPDATTIVVKGIDKQKVGEIAAEIRKIRKPEPYKGKGIRYADELVRRKAGKAATSSGK
ncbi:MAG: 50S ribosomal protein L6 [Actinobacteria bacterium]|nr:50S ribosomal protein L6 [Actinomycetota bacterium]